MKRVPFLPSCLVASMATLVALALLLAMGRSAVASPGETPGVFVGRVVDEAITRATGDMPIQERQAVVRDLLNRYVDLSNFERVTLGRLGRAASEEERNAYFTEFGDLIVRVFAVGAANYGGEKLNILHVHPVSGGEVLVSSEVVRPSNQKFAVDWLLGIGEARYQVRDIIFENISARLLLRDAVANLAERHGGKLSDILPVLKAMGQNDAPLRDINPMNPFGSLAQGLQVADATDTKTSDPASGNTVGSVEQAPTEPMRLPFEPTGAGARFVDIFGYLSVLVRGADLASRGLTVGGIVFLILLIGLGIERSQDRVRDVLKISAWSLVVAGGAGIALEVGALLLSTDLTGSRVAGADFILAGSLRIGGALAVIILLMLPGRARVAPLLTAALVILAGSVMASHSFAQIDHRDVLLTATFIHEVGASAWIGGIPYFLASLGVAERANDRQALVAIGRNFSLLCIGAVVLLLGAGTVLTIGFTQSFEGFYATAYGTMVGSKIAITCGLLLLGAANYRVTERLRSDPGISILRLRRFAEVEIGVGITVFFIAASLTSLPPAKDLENQRPTFAEIVERLTPRMPSLETPTHGDLSIPQLQAKLDAQAKAAAESKIPRAYIPGWVDPPPANAADVLWSEYNHHWAGIFVTLIGIASILELLGLKIMRNWPLIFLGLAVFLFIRSDPSAWPMGDIGFWESMLEPEAFQHKLFVVLIVAFGIFEWMVRTERLKSNAASLVFPLTTAIGGLLLLSHSHSLGNFKEELLIEITHLPLGLGGILAAWARWIELRLPGTMAARIGGWLWRIAFVFIGFMLLSYRET